jgi:hypothetical protein
MLVDVKNCSRCKGEHIDLEFEKLDHSTEVPGFVPIEWWASCPTTSQPIWMSIVDPVSELHQGVVTGYGDE